METHASGPPCRYVLGDRVRVFCITFVYELKGLNIYFHFKAVQYGIRTTSGGRSDGWRLGITLGGMIHLGIKEAFWPFLVRTHGSLAFALD